MSGETAMDQYDNDPDLIDSEIRVVMDRVLDHLVSSYMAQVLGDPEAGRAHADAAQDFMLEQLTPWHLVRAIYTMLWPAVENQALRMLADIPREDP
jgi:hypothetical protein